MFYQRCFNKHLWSVINYALMNKRSYVNTKLYKNLVFLLLQYHLIITILTSEFPKWHCSSYPSCVCNKYQKISSCRFKNAILLYLASVTSASVIYRKVMLRCAIFLFKWYQGLEVELPKRLYTIHRQCGWKCIKMLFLHLERRKMRGK